MERIRLGRTGLMVSRSGFGALPIQRLEWPEATRLVRRAFDGGVNFFDTSTFYTDSEAKLGDALGDVRSEVILATKTTADDRETFFAHLEQSLKSLQTDYIDIYQLHNRPVHHAPDDPDSLYACMAEAQEQGMIRHIGMTTHSLDLARQAVACGGYDTVQYPLSSLSSEKELELIDECVARDVGVIAMKALCGGLITNVPSTFAFLRQFSNLVPIWGIQLNEELDEFLALEASPPALDARMWRAIEADREALAGDFCRSCAYCKPCPEEIPIENAARMSFLLARAPYQMFLTEESKQGMSRIRNCTECGQCKDKCPYNLDVPKILKAQLDHYEAFYSRHAKS